jgi:TolB-like protein/Flp pilus assembly protein TadD
MIAVLPLENLGPPEDEYFASGVTDEITGRLAVVENLGVISRTSAAQYAGSTKTTREIGEELGIDYLLQGTVRWARGGEGSSRVRITPQLVRGSDDTTLWAETYDAVIEDIFEVQSQIASAVASELGMLLLEPEARAAKTRPTENLEAYQSYLRGLHHSNNKDEYIEAARHFERAIELDPEFALAHAELAVAHSAAHFYGRDTTDERWAKATEALERAVELAPDAAEVQLAMGSYRYLERDYAGSLEALTSAGRSRPNDTDVLRLKTFVLRRRGRWDEALAESEKLLELSPRDAGSFYLLAENSMLMRDYEQAMRYMDQAIALDPEYSAGGATVIWLAGSSLPEARRRLEASSRESDFTRWYWYCQEIYEGRYREALERLSSDPDGWFRINWAIRPTSLLEAFVRELLDEPDLAREAYESARVELEAELRVSPDDPRLHSSLGLAYAGLGLADEAIREGKRAVNLQPVSQDAMFGPILLADLALIYLKSGEHDAAVDQIESMLSIPGLNSVSLLRLDPRWRPIHDHPRFKQL